MPSQQQTTPHSHNPVNNGIPKPPIKLSTISMAAGSADLGDWIEDRIGWKRTSAGICRSASRKSAKSLVTARQYDFADWSVIKDPAYQTPHNTLPTGIPILAMLAIWEFIKEYPFSIIQIPIQWRGFYAS